MNEYNTKVGDKIRVSIVSYLVDFWDRRHRGASLGEIAEHVGRSRTTVHHHLKLLEDAGQIRKVGKSGGWGPPDAVEPIQKSFGDSLLERFWSEARQGVVRHGLLDQIRKYLGRDAAESVPRFLYLGEA